MKKFVAGVAAAAASLGACGSPERPELVDGRIKEAVPILNEYGEVVVLDDALFHINGCQTQIPLEGSAQYIQDAKNASIQRNYNHVRYREIDYKECDFLDLANSMIEQTFHETDLRPDPFISRFTIGQGTEEAAELIVIATKNTEGNFVTPDIFGDYVLRASSGDNYPPELLDEHHELLLEIMVDIASVDVTGVSGGDMFELVTINDEDFKTAVEFMRDEVLNPSLAT